MRRNSGLFGLWLYLAFLALCVQAATFPGTARIEVADPSGALSWNPAADALSVACWFKLSVPTEKLLTENMTILVNRRSGTPSDTYSYLVEYDLQTGSIQFSARGNRGRISFPLIEHPYLERWYHVAVARQGEVFKAFVDGREVSIPSSGPVGNTATVEGLSVGGWGGSRYLLGEVQEVSVYQSFTDRNFVTQYMYRDQPTQDPTLNLKGYFKMGFFTNVSERLINLAPVPVPSGSEMGAVAGGGNIEFEETNQAGEQSLFDARKNGGRDALTPLSGSLAWNQTALARPTPGVAFDFQFGYSSANSFGGFKLGSADPFSLGRMGKGWRHTFETQLVPSQDFLPSGSVETIGLLVWNGAIETWDAIPGDDGYPSAKYQTRHKEYRGELYQTNNFYEWRTPERIIYRYRHPFLGDLLMQGKLVEIRDYNANKIRLSYNQNSGTLTQIVDTVQGVYDFRYRGNLLTNVSFRNWQVNFEYDTAGRLMAKWLTNTAPESVGIVTNVNTRWEFRYGTNGLLSQVIDPRGNTNLWVEYDQYGRKTNQMDALSRSTRTEYGMPGKRQIRYTDPEGQQWLETYDRKGRILAQTDPLTNITRYTYDEHGNRISITEPLGWTTYFDYDERANVVARTNALGEITQWKFHDLFNKAVENITPQPRDTNGWTTWTNFYSYDASGNITNHSDALGTLVSYSYLNNGLVHSSTDANQNTTWLKYDTNGFLIARTDPATNTTSFAPNDLGWKLHEENALGEPTDYSYDLNGNPARLVDALGRTYKKVFDPNGNLLSVTDGEGQLATYAYDPVNQRTNMTDRTRTNTWIFIYTSRGKLERVTDPLMHTVVNTYDAANRLIHVTDQLGHSVTNQYDANGNLVRFFDKLGQRWTRTYDPLNRLRTESDPLGNTKQTRYDVAGRVAQVTSPNGYPSLHEYDGRGRLVKWTDPQQFPWLYDYDGVGNITNITDALQGHYVMAYGSRNERILERNQDNFEWHYTYDELLRLKIQRDPNQVERTATYDAGGRVLFVDFSTGRRDAFTYDDNDNMKTLTRRVAGVTSAVRLGYDPLDRVRLQDDANGKTVAYGYDPLSRVTTITYPGNRTLTNNYDALGRLTNQVDWANRKVDYTYDVADRLRSRTYPNRVAQTNGFDSAGRLTALSFSTPNPPASTNSPIQIALSYAYDRNGNKVGGGEIGTLSWPLPNLTDESTHFTPAGRILNREIQTLSATSSQNAVISYHYDPSGNMTNASGNGQSWRLTYDEDNRTMSIAWENEINSKQIVNRYDALGRRYSRIEDGVTTGYVPSLSGGMERILCDLDGANNITAWYVHGPDLCYRVDATNGLICYHADAMANIIALTGGDGSLVAQYAYTPYGRNLGSTNFSSQVSNPYLFVGSQGVMEELPGLYFMRARYYSAEAGVFLSTDPIKNIGPMSKQTTYLYANASPIGFIDPTGLYYTKEQAQKIMHSQQEALKYQLLAIRYDTQANILQGVYDALQTTKAVLTGNVSGMVSGIANQLSTLASVAGWSKSADTLHSAATVVDLAGYASDLGHIYKNYDKLLTHYNNIEVDWSRIAEYSAKGPVGSLYASVLQPVAENSFTLGDAAIVTRGISWQTLKPAKSGAQTQDAISSAGRDNSSGCSFLADRARSADKYADGINSLQHTLPASSFNMADTTPAVSGGSFSSATGNSSFSSLMSQASIAFSNAANSLSQSARNTATALGNWFSSLFGGRN